MTREQALETLRQQNYEHLNEDDFQRIVTGVYGPAPTSPGLPADPHAGIPIVEPLGGPFGPLLDKLRRFRAENPGLEARDPEGVRSFVNQQPEFQQAMNEINRSRRQHYADMGVGEAAVKGAPSLPGRLPGAVWSGIQAFTPATIGGPKAGGVYKVLREIIKEFPSYYGLMWRGATGEDITEQEWEQIAERMPTATAMGKDTQDLLSEGGLQERLVERPEEVLSMGAELLGPIARVGGMGARAAKLPRLARVAGITADVVDAVDPYAVVPNVGGKFLEKFARGDFTTPYSDAYKPEVDPVLRKYSEEFGGKPGEKPDTPIGLETSAEPVIKREAADIMTGFNKSARTRWDNFTKGINKLVDKTISMAGGTNIDTADVGRQIAIGFDKHYKKWKAESGAVLEAVKNQIGHHPANYNHTIAKLDEILEEYSVGAISENEVDIRRVQTMRDNLAAYMGQAETTPTAVSGQPIEGQPYEFDSVRNTEQAPNMGTQYGQDIEPAGVYMTKGTPQSIQGMPNWVSSRVRFENPLVIEWGEGYSQPGNWKKVLTQRFDGKTGAELSDAIAAAGYDGIVTTRPFQGGIETSEIVDLRTRGTSPTGGTAPVEPQKPWKKWTMNAQRNFLESTEPHQMTREQFNSWKHLSYKNEVRADRMSRALSADPSNELPTAIRNHSEDFGYEEGGPGFVEKFIDIEPDDTVTIYRAISSDDPSDGILPGDWVALERWYADEHGADGYGDVGSKVVELEVRAADVTWAGTDQNEWIYSPRDLRSQESLGAHESMIKQAMEEGESIPPEVMAEYPRLQQAPSGEGGPLSVEAYKYPTADAFIKAPYKIETILSQKYSGVTVDISEKNGTITLSRVIVPESQRGEGIGTTLMDDLIDYADKTGQRIVLTPTGDFGGNVKRLKDFYKSFGFVENKGQSKDFTTRETFIRGQVSDDYDQRLAQLWEESRQPAVPATTTPTTPTTPTGAYQLAGDTVDGLTVRGEIPNTDSIGATFDEYEVLDGVREVSMDEFGGPQSVFYAADDFNRSKTLAEKIEQSGEISPLIIAVDSDGPYILEGAHRYVALHNMGKKSFPAIIVKDLDSVDTAPTTPTTPTGTLTISDLDKERSSFRRQQKEIYTGDVAEVQIPLNKAWGMQIYDAMTDDMYEAAMAASPEDAAKLRQGKLEYYKGTQKFNSIWGKRIKALVEGTSKRAGGRYKELVEKYILNPSGSGFFNEVDMPAILATVGEDAQQAIKGELLVQIFERAQPGRGREIGILATSEGDLTASALRRSVSKVDRKVMTDVLGDDIVELMDDLQMLLNSSGGLRSTIGGSQTAYNQHAINQIAKMAALLRFGIGAAAGQSGSYLFGDLPGPEWVAGAIIGLVGQPVYDAFRQSKFSKRWQLQGYTFPETIQKTGRIMSGVSPAAGFVARVSTQPEVQQRKRSRAMDVLLGLPYSSPEEGQRAMDKLLLRNQPRD